VYSVNIANIFVLERDPKDAKYVDLAIATKADFLVTRDKDLLDLREKESPRLQIFETLDWQFKIVDPFEMLTFLRKE
jgi:predicted nucleic acid-binding protein